MRDILKTAAGVCLGILLAAAVVAASTRWYAERRFAYWCAYEITNDAQLAVCDWLLPVDYTTLQPPDGTPHLDYSSRTWAQTKPDGGDR